MGQFVKQNQDPEILRRKTIRAQLRSMDGQQVAFFFQRNETHTVEDGQETYTYTENGETKTGTRTRYSQVSVLMTYNGGIFTLATQNKSLIMAPGFNPSLSASGTGVAIAPHTQVRHNITNTAILGCAELGINSQYTMTEPLERLIKNNLQQIGQGWNNLLQAHMKYRSDLNTTREAKEKILSSAFWYLLYLNILTSIIYRNILHIYLYIFDIC
jgi:hypothetical protein